MPYNPKTQKAKGIIALEGTYPMPRVYDLFAVKKGSPKQSTLAYLQNGTKMFARPCPPSPEHGFVESRVINSEEQLQQVIKETLAANEDSEVILMDPVNALWNAIWTPSMIAIGPGHDGATSGKGCFSIPLAGVDPLTKTIKSLAGITETPYIEVVGAEYGEYYLTQLRNGPALESLAPDFTPGEFVVGDVIKTNGEDLLEWAKVVKNLAAINAESLAKTVVYHPTGALTDHYSVHCRIHGVPIFLTRCPESGEAISGTTEVPPDPDSMKLGVLVGDHVDLHINKDKAVWASLLALHNSAAMKGSNAFWLGVAASLLVRLGSAALRGEARHAHHAKSRVRAEMHDFYAKRKISFHRASISRLTQILTYGFGDVNKGHSYGGPKWGNCGAAMVPLFNSIRDLFQKSTPESANALTGAINLVINQAHNGGWWLNKFTDKSAYDNIPQADFSYLFRMVPFLREVWEEKSKVTSDQIKRFSSTVSSWPVTEIRPLRWRKASLDVLPGAFVINLKAATVPTHQQVTIPINPNLLDKLLGKVTKLRVDKSGLTFVAPDGKEIPIWTEYNLDPTQTKVTR